jgi:selenophosphate synthetase-related protein
MLKTAADIVISAALMFSAPAFAVDGQVLINQSTVMAAGGFPYKIT